MEARRQKDYFLVDR